MCCNGLGCQRLVGCVCVCVFFLIKALVVLNLNVNGYLDKEILRQLKEIVKKRKLFFKS